MQINARAHSSPLDTNVGEVAYIRDQPLAAPPETNRKFKNCSNKQSILFGNDAQSQSYKKTELLKEAGHSSQIQVEEGP